MAFIKIQDMGLTDDAMEKIRQELWAEENATSGKCPACLTEIGQHHKDGCDVARCMKCCGQFISCDCKKPKPDTWDGLWPNTRFCYENKLVCWDTASSRYMFDLNEAARLLR